MIASNNMPTRKVIRGDSDPFKITFNDVHKNSMGVKVKEPIDISTWVIKFTVRVDVPATKVNSDEDAPISIVAEIVDGPNGVALINIKNTDTNIDVGSYWYDIQYTKNIGTDNEITKSLAKGSYVILGDITRS